MMVARLKLKGIDGRAHQEWSLRLNLTQHGETYQVELTFGPGTVGGRERWCQVQLAAVLPASTSVVPREASASQLGCGGETQTLCDTNWNRGHSAPS